MVSKTMMGKQTGVAKMLSQAGEFFLETCYNRRGEYSSIENNVHKSIGRSVNLPRHLILRESSYQ